MITLPLETMSYEEKLSLLEILWDDITHGQKEFQSPLWHGELLKARKAAIADGSASYLDWNDVKSELKDLIK